MAIEKIIPRRLNADIDEKLLSPESGQMTDALNVTVQNSGSSTSGVIKNTYGTEVINPATEADRIQENTDGYTVIGSAEDDVNQYVYWFVSDDDDGNRDAIYRQSNGGGDYSVVLQGDLNFDSDSFVKADVLTGRFQQDDNDQTILYFTDNVNPPRKINVDRAIDGAYEGLTDFEKRISIEAIKGAEVRSPDFTFSSDTSVKVNNFADSVFQFATQYIYIDGEESAISPYSGLAVSRAMSLQALQDDGSDAPSLSRLTDNLCLVSLNIDPYKTDIEEVRILARKSNTGTFFILDQFDPKVNYVRSIYGSNVNVYNASTGEYRFYNDRLGPSIPTSTTNKLYDNVPFLAQGQALSGKRVVYSNYVEGRPNNPITSGDITLSVSYSTANTTSASLIDSGDLSNVISQGTQSTQEVEINLVGGTGSNWGSGDYTTVVEGGTVVNLVFSVEPTAATVGKSGGGDLISFPLTQATEQPDGNNTYVHGDATLTSLDISPSQADNDTVIPVNISYTVPFDTTINGVRQQLVNYLEANPIEGEVTYDLASALDLTVSGSLQATRLSTSSGIKVTYRLDDIDTTNNTSSFKIKTRITKISFSNPNLTAGPGATYDNIFSPDGGLNGNVLAFSTTAATDFAFTGSGGDAPVPGLVTEKATAITSETLYGFKTGSTHDFGIVYYDRFNRSGFVNRIGSIYVPTLGERRDLDATAPLGAASVRVTFSDNYNPPSWATRYQIVYSGRSSVGDFTQYTVGNGFVVRQKHDTAEDDGIDRYKTAVDENSHRIYVSLKTLDTYNSDKSTVREYSFTKGDKLRVISHGNSDDTARVYPVSAASGGGGSGEPIEFDIVGVEVLSTQAVKNPTVGHATIGNTDNVNESRTGTFLVLEAPNLETGVGKYVGFDWFEMANKARPDGSAASSSNKWDQDVLVEIYSPKSPSEDTVYYEIGHGARAGVRKDTSINSHGDTIDLYNGDVIHKPVSCLVPGYDSGWDSSDPSGWSYITLNLESSNPSEKQIITDWNRGRPHSVFENAARIRRFNGITYSDAYEEDVANLSLSSFNLSLANFLSLDGEYGGINYIGNVGENLVSIQENKVGYLSVNESILRQSDGGQLAALSTLPFSFTRYYAGDYGCGEDPSSVLMRDGFVFFFDRSRMKLVRLTSEGLSPVSDTGIRSFIDSNQDNYLTTGNAVVSGYDPRTNEFFFTFRPNGSFVGETYSYSPSIGGWQSRHSFYPDMYACQDSTMYTAFYRDPDGSDDDDQIIFHKHTDSADRTSFYGQTAAGSLVTVVANDNASLVKTYNAISYESDVQAFDTAAVTTSLGQRGGVNAPTGDDPSFVAKEGFFYSDLSMDESGNSTRHILPIGEVSENATNSVTFTNRVNVLPLIPGATVMEIDGSTLSNIGTGGAALTFSGITNNRKIVLSGATTVDLTGKDLVLVTSVERNGDPLRGSWAKITITDTGVVNGNDPFELYSINAHYSASPQNHALGQQ